MGPAEFHNYRSHKHFSISMATKKLAEINSLLTSSSIISGEFCRPFKYISVDRNFTSFSHMHVFLLSFFLNAVGFKQKLPGKKILFRPNWISFILLWAQRSELLAKIFENVLFLLRSRSFYFQFEIHVLTTYLF